MRPGRPEEQTAWKEERLERFVFGRYDIISEEDDLAAQCCGRLTMELKGQ